MDFEKDINIDEQALDVECLEQPRITLQYAKWVADMERKKDRAKERVDVVKAELDKDIRNNPDKYGLAKITEGAVQNTIILQPEYREAQEAYIEAKHESDIAKAAMRAVDTKKTALENLVKLFGLSYFAGPSAPRNLAEERAKKQRESNQKVAKAMRRKKQ